MLRAFPLTSEARRPYSIMFLVLVSTEALSMSNFEEGLSKTFFSSSSYELSMVARYWETCQLQSGKALISASTVECSKIGGLFTSLLQSTDVEAVEELPVSAAPIAQLWLPQRQLWLPPPLEGGRFVCMMLGSKPDIASWCHSQNSICRQLQHASKLKL